MRGSVNKDCSVVCGVVVGWDVGRSVTGMAGKGGGRMGDAVQCGY